MKNAVDSGYWSCYRYNPALAEEGKNPFSLDTKDPVQDYKTFLLSETRYASLKKLYPDHADTLFDISEEQARQRREGYKALASKE
jgi:pyruvate-ferredoxin/flavodoxin oxidoreductase